MVNRPPDTNPFEFVAVASLRTLQLMRGCVPRVPPGHKRTTTAQLEVVAGHVSRLVPPPPDTPDPA